MYATQSIGTFSYSAVLDEDFISKFHLEPFIGSDDEPRSDIIGTAPPRSAASDKVRGSRVLPFNVVPLRREKEHTKARFRMLRRLPANHDGEGASGAQPASVDAAIAFLDEHAIPQSAMATLDDDGLAVIEIYDLGSGLFADITFKEDGTLECYARSKNEQSTFVTGAIDANQIREVFESIGVR